MISSLAHSAPADAFASAGELYIGLMSGTSTDGVDAVLARFHDNAPPVVLAHASLDMPAGLRREFLALNAPVDNELHRAALAGNALAALYAAAVDTVLSQTEFTAADIKAIGAHGQTIRHDPEAGYSLQINAPARLAELTGIAVVADFRSRDIAAGGQGAPLVPAFHQALFADTAPRVVLNLGGIANITILSPDAPVSGFDTGPANVLLDAWIQEKTGARYDRNGSWAARGTACAALLQHLLQSEPWLALAPPKSTGRHLFNAQWLHGRLESFDVDANTLSAADIQATLQEFTARTVADAIRLHAPETTELLVCGGGALNLGLMTALRAAMPSPCRVISTADLGVPVQLVEALAFAWLARAWNLGIAASLPSVTGASQGRVLGCKYPAV